MSDSGANTARGLVERMLERLENWARKDELGALPPGELERLAHDIGLNGNELERLSQLDNTAPNLLYARLSELGFDMKEIEAQGVGDARDMERTCALCGDRELCAHDLVERPESGEWRRICPNNGTFEAMERLRAATLTK